MDLFILFNMGILIRSAEGLKGVPDRFFTKGIFFVTGVFAEADAEAGYRRAILERLARIWKK